jgi:fumarate reductase subunit C
MPRDWWMKREGYRLYMLREATSIFVLLFSIELYSALFALVKGPENWARWIEAVQAPPLVFVNLLMFVAITWHMITWFKLTPQTMPLKVKGKAVAGKTIVIAHYVAMAVISICILIILGGAI